MIDIYRAHFEASQAEAMPLITNIVTSVEMISAYTDTWKEAGHITHVIEPQPCFARYYTSDMVETYLRRDVAHRDEFKRGVQLLFRQYQSIEESAQSYFSVDGLRCFVKTGIMADLPPQYATPFTLEDREHLLTAMRTDIVSDKILYRALNPAKFMISPVATIQLFKDHYVMFLSSGDGYMVSSLLHEKALETRFLISLRACPIAI